MSSTHRRSKSCPTNAPREACRPATRRGRGLGRFTSVGAALAILLVTAAPAAAQDKRSAQGQATTDRNKRLVQTYRDMLAEDPDQSYAMRRLLEVSHAVGGVKGLVKLYNDAVKAKPNSYEDWMVLGHIHRASESVDLAVAAYQKAAKIKAKKASPHLATAQLFVKVTQYAKALVAYDLAIGLLKKRTQKQDALKAAAEAAIQLKAMDRAEAYFKRLVKTEPRNLFLRMEYASTLGRLGDNKRSLALWMEIRKKAGKQLKHLVIVWQEIAQIQERLDRMKDAEATWREAMKKTPSGHWARPAFVEGLIALYRKQDNLRDLIKEFEPKLRSSYEMLVTVARLYEEVADDDQALKLFKQAVKRRPGDGRARMRMIALLERVGTPAEVIDAYRKLVRSNPGEPRHELRLAELYFNSGKVKDGFKLLTKMGKRYREDPGVHQAIIDLTMRYGDMTMRKRIEGSYKKLMRMEPREESHIISLGEYYWSSGNRPRALSIWKKLLNLGRSKGEGMFLLAEVYADHNMFVEAEDTFRKALKKEPANERFAKAFALMLQKQRKFRMALKQWQHVIKHARKSSTIREARRQIIGLWEKDGRLNKEITNLEKRFAATPPSLSDGQFLASAYIRLRRAKEARRVLERLHKLEPKNVETLTGLELVYTRLSLIKEAIAVLDELAKVNTRSASEYMHRAADLALSEGQDKLALSYMRKVVELNPADPLAHARVGELHQRMGNLADAAEAWRQSLVLDDRNHRVRFKLAGLYRDLGSLLREEQVLGQIVRDARDPSDVLLAGRRLLQVAGTTGRMEAAESVIRPLVFNRQNKNVYLRLLVEVYALLSQQLAYSDQPRAARRAALRGVGERGLKPLLDALADSDVALRARALTVLKLTRPAGAASALARLLKAGDSQLQVHAAVALGHVGTSSAANALAGLVTKGSLHSRQVVIWALGLSGKRAKPAEATVVVKEPTKSKGAKVAKAKPAGKAGAILSKALVSGSSSHRRLAALALGRVGDRTHAPVLERAAATGDANSRTAALWAVASIAAPTSVPVLEAQLRSANANTAAMAAWGLQRINTDAAQLALVRALWTPDLRAPQAVADALLGNLAGVMPGTDQADALASAYEAVVQVDPRGRQVSITTSELYAASRPARVPAEALAKIGPALEKLVNKRADGILGARDRNASAAMIRSLLSADGNSLTLRPFFGAKSAMGERLAAGIGTRYLATLREAAQGAIGTQAQTPALAVLTLLAQRPKSQAVGTEVIQVAIGILLEGGPASIGAAKAIATIGDAGLDGVGRTLLDALAKSGDNWLLRAAIVRALATIGGPAATEPVRNLLDDPYAAVRVAAAKAVETLADPSLVRSLAPLVRDRVSDVALAAISALSKFRSDPVAIEALTWAKNRGNSLVSTKAAAALGVK